MYRIVLTALNRWGKPDGIRICLSPHVSRIECSTLRSYRGLGGGGIRTNDRCVAIGTSPIEGKISKWLVNATHLSPACRKRLMLYKHWVKQRPPPQRKKNVTVIYNIYKRISIISFYCYFWLRWEGRVFVLYQTGFLCPGLKVPLFAVTIALIKEPPKLDPRRIQEVTCRSTTNH